MNPNLEMRIAKSKDEIKQAFWIREQVFMIEQGMPRHVEFDKYDDSAYHVVAYLENKPIGCARMRKIGSRIKMQRIAILSKYRGKGFGKRIVKFMVNFGKKQKVSELFMNAQHYLKHFYESFGFRARGKIFKEGKIDHIEMFLKIW
jgi:predicted GNAT family N-acyltransferase